MAVVHENMLNMIPSRNLFWVCQLKEQLYICFILFIIMPVIFIIGRYVYMDLRDVLYT